MKSRTSIDGTGNEGDSFASSMFERTIGIAVKSRSFMAGDLPMWLHTSSGEKKMKFFNNCRASEDAVRIYERMVSRNSA